MRVVVQFIAAFLAAAAIQAQPTLDDNFALSAVGSDEPIAISQQDSLNLETLDTNSIRDKRYGRYGGNGGGRGGGGGYGGGHGGGYGGGYGGYGGGHGGGGYGGQRGYGHGHHG